MNRHIQPAIKNDFRLAEPQIKKITLSNGVPFYSIIDDTEELFKLELIFSSCTLLQKKSTQANLMFSLLTEGTSNYSAQQINETFEKYGCIIQKSAGKEFSTFTLFCLNRYAQQVLPFLKEILWDAIFPDEELKILCNTNKKSLAIKLKNTDIISERNLFSQLFDDNSPYARFAQPIDYDSIQREDIIEYYDDYFKTGLELIIMSGNCSETIIEHVINLFGDINIQNNLSQIPDLTYRKRSNVHHHHEMEDSVQCSISAGRSLFNMSDDDFKEFMLLNTVFGGYFGSRLMHNIREKNGFTYGISSMINTYSKGGILIVSTDVGSNVAEKAIDEIKAEMRKLRSFEVDSDELNKVKNYLGGSISRSFDNVFAVAERIKKLWNQGLDLPFYDELLTTVQLTNAERLKQLSEQYLNDEDWIFCTAGHKI